MTTNVLKNGKPVSGTLEWASKNVNFINGCSHDCKYCYAKSIAVRFKRKTVDNWKEEIVIYDKLNKMAKKVDGRIMLSSTHDHMPEHFDVTIKMLDKLLKTGNDVLVVSKPHLEVIQKICEHFPAYKDKILFRFTIGSMDNNVLKFWEPGAPDFEERLAALKFAHSAGYQTSVSCEPALDGNTYELTQELLPYVTDSIWIGLANRLNANLKLNGHGDVETRKMADELQKIQSDAWVFGLYKNLGNNSKIRWKDSCKKILKLEQPTVKGLDI
ncbi:radical SAM protein [Maribellus mangrovi]|uniref:radical SAM protein n=1 Tax=Maribellus mangrovi TaxID=3133146 RepID=UPI0030EC21D0